MRVMVKKKKQEWKLYCNFLKKRREAVFVSQKTCEHKTPQKNTHRYEIKPSNKEFYCPKYKPGKNASSKMFLR